MKFPHNESSINTLAYTINAGLAAHPTDFPSIDPTGLAGLHTEYMAAWTAATEAKAAYRQAIAEKNARLNAMTKRMKSDLKLAEVDCIEDPQKLYEIGWAPKSAPTPLAAPGQVDGFIAVVQGPGSILLKWNKPATGGRVSNYIIRRRIQETAGEFSDWLVVESCFNIETELIEQPRGCQLEYTVTATNPAGDALVSNTVSAVL
ncbi:MAG: fibronectin type III domain-containing protein [Phycisphaerae bacterium]|nr:fibronectin type III domain-containing protein [Phycisphaerae bacterium]